MSEESLRGFIPRRKRELTNQIAGLEGQVRQLHAVVAHLKTELAELDRIEKTLPPLPPLSAAFTGSVTYTAAPSTNEPEPSGIVTETTRRALAMAERFRTSTIKELVVQALLDHYPDGASMTSILHFIRDAYGREIPSSSLRPQMHRMKTDYVLVQGPDGHWNLTSEKRKQYALYDHPTSRAAMKELQDDVVDESSSGEAPPRKPARFIRKSMRRIT